MENHADYIKAMYTDIAGTYDTLNRVLSLLLDKWWRKSAVSRCGLPAGGRALDVATGTGDMARRLARLDGGCTVVGIDLCPQMLERARAKLSKAVEGNRIWLAQGDALRLPFPDNSFDCATIGFGLRNVASVADALSEMARVVRPGGRVVSLELTQPSSRAARAIHSFYMWHFLQQIGRLVSGNSEAYRYLPRSIVEFASPQEVKGMMEEAGLGQVDIHRPTLGVVTIHVGVVV